MTRRLEEQVEGPILQDRNTWSSIDRCNIQRICKNLVGTTTTSEQHEGIRIQPKKQKTRWLFRKRERRWGPEATIEAYTNLLYRSTYRETFLWFVVLYFVMVTFFTACLLGIVVAHDNHGRECVDGWDYSVQGAERAGENFEIAWSLSWTTFSTVGYGTISPPAEDGCMLLRLFLSFEAFTGILYAGFCGAIFYSKVSRQTTGAKVTFSNAVCLQFGKDGITDFHAVLQKSNDGEDVVDREVEKTSSDTEESQDGPHDDEEESTLDWEDEARASRKIIPYPVLDFRVVNDKMHLPGNDMLGVSIFALAVSIVPSAFTRLAVEKYMKRKQLTPNTNFRDLYNETKLSGGGTYEPATKTYTEMKITPTTVPFFDSTFYMRHVLDADSPLLKGSIRAKIKELGGWPKDIDDHASIRDCFSSHVYEINIAFEATSNLTASTVFKLQRYTFEDIYVGWRFVGFIGLENAIETEEVQQGGRPSPDQIRDLYDLSRVHDIVPQHGGGNEPVDRALQTDYFRKFFSSE